MAAGVAALGASVVAVAVPVVVLVAPVVVDALPPVLMTALVSVNSDAAPGRVVAETAPLVPVAPAGSARCTQPVTIIIAGLL